MPSTYSPNLRIELIANGEQSGTWGTTTNTNLGTLIEDAIAGYVSVSITSANQALTASNGTADQSRNMIVNLTTTTTADFNVYIPPAEKFYVIRNATAYNATIYCSTVLGNTTAAGLGVTVLANSTTIIFSDATNVRVAIDSFSASSLVAANLIVNGNTTLGNASGDSITLTGTVQPGVVVSGSSSGDALRITQTGAGNAFVVEDSANPDATPFVVSSIGDVIIGHTTGLLSGSLEVVGTDVATTREHLIRYSNDTDAAGVFWNKSRNATIGSHTVVQSGDSLGYAVFRGSDGASFVIGAQIEAFVDGTPGTNDMPGRLVFSTTADGASTPTERMRINSSGTISITGALTASADSSFTSTGALLISKGTTGQQPGSPATGMMRYNTTTNQFEGYSGSSPAWKSIGGSALSNDTSTASNLYPVFAGATSGTAENLYTSNAKLLYKPSTGELSASVPRASNGIFVNTANVSTSYTIASGDNGVSAGTITVDNGVTVTVSNGSRWVVV